MSKISKTSGYGEFLKVIKDRIRSAQYDALKAVNKEMIRLYWDIGKTIVTRQKEYGWGRSIVMNLAMDLRAEFPGMQGFSDRNIWNMRNFFVLYNQKPKLQPLVAEISWAKHLIIMSACKDDLEREFYILMTKRMGWTKNVLSLQIKNKTYEKTLLNQTNFSQTIPALVKAQASLTVKDEYTFDFLTMGEKYTEMELERALISKVNRFLAEMGGAYAFVGNQYRLEVDDCEYFIDLLLYHRRLRSLIAVELKVGKFIPEYVGKMQFYLAALDSTVREKGENPAIGIILCQDKGRTTVEYALKESRKPIAVARYRITSTLPKALKKELPAPEQICALLDGIRKPG